MFRVMALLQTDGGTITRCVGEFGGDDALAAAESFRSYWNEQPWTLLTWLA